MVAKHPPIAAFVQRIMEHHGPAADEQDLSAYAGAIIDTLAFELVYSRCPEAYDSLPFHNWDFQEVTTIVPLDDRVVVDGGAGTGRVALAAAQAARLVYAVEPVSRLRAYLREKAAAVLGFATASGHEYRSFQIETQIANFKSSAFSYITERGHIDSR